VVEESDFQSFVQDQVVQVYDNSGARGSALGTAVAEGMVSYLKDTNLVEVYDGSGWQNFTGDITAVTAGTALTGGGTSGAVTLNVNQDALFTDGTEGFTMVSSGTAGVTYQPISPNYIINGAFDIWQRGTSANVNLAYAADRWLVQTAGSGMTFSTTQEAFTAGDIEAIGFGDAQYFYRMTCTTAGSGIVLSIRNRIEDARTLAGQTVTLSFWAKTDSSRTMLPRLDRVHGTGGSSTAFISFAGVTIGSSWQRYSVSAVIPSLAGLTVGANSYLQVVLPIEIADGSVFDFWGVQLEAGSVATPFRRNANSIQGELAACQRYYQKYDTPQNHTNSTGYLESATTARTSFPLSVPMRSAPTFTITGTFGIVANGVLYTVTYLNANFVENGAFIRQTWNGTGLPNAHACALRHNGTAEFSAEL
jgi:hypothetical protein